MALLGVNSAYVPEEPEKGQSQSTSDIREDKNCSIFDKDEDGTVTAQEQQDALREAASQDDMVKRAVIKGFDLEMYLSLLGNLCKDIKTDVSQRIGKLIVTPQQMTAYANRVVQNLIDILKDLANEFLQQEFDKDVEFAKTLPQNQNAKLVTLQVGLNAQKIKGYYAVNPETGTMVYADENGNRFTEQAFKNWEQCAKGNYGMSNEYDCKFAESLPQNPNATETILQVGNDAQIVKGYYAVNPETGTMVYADENGNRFTEQAFKNWEYFAKNGTFPD